MGPTKIAVPAAKATKTPTTTAACCDSSRHERSSALQSYKCPWVHSLVNRDPTPLKHITHHVIMTLSHMFTTHVVFGNLG